MNEAEAISTAKVLLARGWGWKKIARHLRVGPTWLKNRMIPGWRESRAKIYAKHRERHRNGSERSVDSQAMRLKAQIPPDTRDFTARVLGDPLPGRSALDQRRRA